MRFLLTFLVICFGIVSSMSVHAKDLERFLLRGYIYMADDEAPDSISVNLTKNDTVQVPFKLLIGNNEERMIDGNQLRAMVYSGMGDYTLTLFKEGYKPVSRDFSINSVSEEVKNLRAFRFERDTTMGKNLDEVTVTATKIKMVMKGDTIVYDASAFQLTEGSMLDALVRQLPNATLDDDGVITVNGRTINELLVNGKDFFKGDPKIALQNLPGYTVKNVKVYDKEADDAYLTHSNQRIANREEDENLVMDVQLKKEYMTGWLMTAGAGYGTDNRYQGRAFVLGYTDKVRVSAFGNVNNIGNTNGADPDGNWSDWSDGGNTTVQKGGANYTYDDNGDWKANGDIVVERQRVIGEQIGASTSFYPSGDLFNRNVSSNRNVSHSISTNHEVRYNGSNFSITMMPGFHWSKDLRRNESRQATFNRNPEESFRGEAIDSLYSRGSDSKFYNMLLNRIRNLGRNRNHSINGDLSAHLTFRPKTWKGYLSAYASGSIGHRESENHTLRVQSFGPQASSADRPVNRDQWSPAHTDSKDAAFNVSYHQDFRTFGDVRTRTWSMNFTTRYSHHYSNDLTELYLGADSVPENAPLPSLMEPAGAVMDILNSYNSRGTDHTAGVSGRISYRIEPTAPTATGMNPTYSVGVTLSDELRYQRLDYIKPQAAPDKLKQTVNIVRPGVFMHFNSANDLRNIGLSFNYSYNQSPPSLSSRLNDRASSNPLVQYRGAEGLKRAATHSVSINWMRWSRGTHHANTNVNLNWNMTSNAHSNAIIRNAQTGMTIYTPMNISGNWNANGNVSYSIEVGPSNCWELNGHLRATYANSADYITLETDPVRSSVRNLTLSPHVNITYRLRAEGPFDGSTFSLNGGMSWNKSTSERPGFVPINSYDYSFTQRIFLNLPWNMKLQSQLQSRIRTHYSDDAMNSTEWVWNASLEKSLLKGAMSVKVEGVDILASRKDINVRVNAQGRYETWRNSMPRYGMLTVSYRFSIQPKKKDGGDNPGFGPGPGRGFGPGPGRHGGGRGMRPIRGGRRR